MAQEEEDYKTIEMSVFKAKLCEYVRALAAGEENAFVIRRYRQDIAIVTRLGWLRCESAADEALTGLRAHLAALESFKEQRRMIAAHALSWPSKKFALLRRPAPPEQACES